MKLRLIAVGIATVIAWPLAGGAIGAGSTSVAGGAECDGVTVVVDDGDNVRARCAAAGTSGLQALQDARFSVSTIDQGGFLCQIDGKPKKKECKDSAGGTSWYYYYADADGPWQYSSLGAGNRTVVDGGFEGWKFGAKAPPDYDLDESAEDAGQGDEQTDDDQTDNNQPADSQAAGQSSVAATAVAIAAVVILAVASLIVIRRRRRS